MENSDISISLFYDVHTNHFKIKTNLKEDKINDVLSECYIATLKKASDHRNPNLLDVYSVLIKLDLSEDKFNISSNTGNNVLAYELIKQAIDNWEIVLEETSLDKGNLEEIIMKNVN